MIVRNRFPLVCGRGSGTSLMCLSVPPVERGKQIRTKFPLTSVLQSRDDVCGTLGLP